MATLKTVTANANSTVNVLSLLATSREAVKAIGVSNAAAATAYGVLTASIVLAYQNDEQTRKEIAFYLGSRIKGTDKTIREKAVEWMLKEFELSKPGKGARGKERFMFNNRVAKIEGAFKRAVEYTERGLAFTQDGKRVYITADTYRKIVNDHVGSEPIEVTTMNEKDSVTWSGLMPKKERNVAQANGATVIAASPANLAILCKAVKTATETVEPQKLAGSDRIAMLDAFFALQIALGAKEDKALISQYDTLTKAQA